MRIQVGLLKITFYLIKFLFIIINGFRVFLEIQDVVYFGLGMVLLWCLQAFETSSFC